MMPLFAQAALPDFPIDPVAAWIIASALIGYLLLLFAVSMAAARRVKTEADYLVAGRQLPLVLVCASLVATWFDAATMFAASGAAREVGLLGIVLTPFAAAGGLVLAGIFFARPLWKLQLFTMADFYRTTYGPTAELVGACIQVPAYFSWVALQYLALARIAELYFGLPVTIGILLVAAITLGYTLTGGLWSVASTDTVQIVVAVGGLLVLTAATLSDERLGAGDPLRGLAAVFARVAATHPDHLRFFPVHASPAILLGWLAAWATGLFGNLPVQDLQQRVFAAKTAGTAAAACILAGIFYLVCAMLPVTLGLASLVTHPEGELDPIGFLAGEYLSTGMLVVFVVAVTSVVISSATSAVLAPATILGHNLLARLPLFGDRPLFRDRSCVALVSLGSVGTALGGTSLMQLLDVSLSIQLVALFVPLVMGVYGRPRGELPAVLSMLLGFAVWLTAFTIEHVGSLVPGDVFGVVTTVPSVFWGLGAGIIGYALGQWRLLAADPSSR
jgi:SSS family solute:Na+ symporter